MDHRVCPRWLGYLLLLPIRRFWQDPRRLLGPFVREGMTILEPGPAMGFFTLDLARMVGPRGRVVAVDVQESMLKVLRRRAQRAGLEDRIDARRAEPDRLGIGDLAGRVDLVLAVFVVHEMPDAGAFFSEARRSLRSEGRLIFAEPKRHVPKEAFDRSLEAARAAGFATLEELRFPGASAVVLRPRP